VIHAFSFLCLVKGYLGMRPLEGEKAFIPILLVFHLQRKKEKDCGVGKVVSRAR
jgi:hypothetical protein